MFDPLGAGDSVSFVIVPCTAYSSRENNYVTVTSTASLEPAAGSPLAQDIEALVQKLQNVRASIGQVIFGQEQVVDQTLITLLSGGHALLIGVPGLAWRVRGWPC